VRRTFVSKKDEVTGEWRRLHKEELYDPYCSPNIIRVKELIMNEMGGACRTYGGEEMCMQDFG
jgi:hypothetical protein